MDYNVATSFNRKKWFDKFKNDMEKIPKIDIVLDGANIGFANANRKINRQNVYLNAQNIEWVIQELQDQGLQSFVILHHYHINHLLKSNPSQIDILEVHLFISFHFRNYTNKIYYIMFEKDQMMIGIGYILLFLNRIDMYCFHIKLLRNRLYRMIRCEITYFMQKMMKCCFDIFEKKVKSHIIFLLFIILNHLLNSISLNPIH